MSDEDQSEDTSGFIMGGGVPSAKFENLGDSIEGYITAKAMRQQTDFKTQEPLFFQNGDKRMQLVVTLATEDRDDEIEDDDGSRRVYIKAASQKALAKACKAAGVKDVHVGGYLVMTFSAKEKPRQKGEQGAKIYDMEYTPPSTDSQQFLAGDDTESETPAKKAPAKKAPPAPPVDPWVEDEEHVTDADGNRWVWDVDKEDWDEYVAPARKAPAKKAPAKAVAADPGF